MVCLWPKTLDIVGYGLDEKLLDNSGLARSDVLLWDPIITANNCKLISVGKLSFLSGREPGLFFIIISIMTGILGELRHGKLAMTLKESWLEIFLHLFYEERQQNPYFLKSAPDKCPD